MAQTEENKQSSGKIEAWLPGRELARPATATPDGPISTSGGVGDGDLSASADTQADRAGGLPLVEPGADLARTRVRPAWVALVFGLTFFLYVSFIPRFILYSSPPTGDQPSYLMVTTSIAQDGDLNTANNYANRDEDRFYRLAPHPPGFVGISAPYPLPPHRAFSSARPPEEVYSFHLPGLPLLLVPSWVIGSWLGLWWPATVVFMCGIGALVATNVFLLANELTGRTWIAWAVWLPMAFSNPLMSYSYLIFTELTVGLFTIYVFRRLALGWGQNGLVRIFLLGFCIGYIPWLSWRCIVIVAPLLLYGVVQWWRNLRAARRTGEEKFEVAIASENQPTHGRRVAGLGGLALFLLPVSVSAVLLVWHNYFLYGQPFLPNYLPERGPDVIPFLWPWLSVNNLVHFVTNLFAHMFDRQMGLLTYAPIYLLAAVGAIVMFRSARRSDPRMLLWIALLVLPYLALVSAFIFWSGLWNPPARFLTAVVPLMSAPLAMSLFALRRSILYKTMYALLAVPGFVFMAVRMYDARFMWPYPSILNWFVEAQESPLRIDLRNILPAFDPLDDVRLPLNTAWITAASIAIVLFSYLLLPRGSSLWSSRRLPYALHGLIWLSAISVIGSGWLIANHQYIQHRTVLTEVKRWQLDPAPVRPYGITYLGGRVYVTGFGYQEKSNDTPGTLGELDVSTGVYQLITPVSARGVVTYGHPGDVKAGSDGLLRLLNNGPDDHAMYTMKPNGEIVRQLRLEGVTPIATGFDYGPDGNIYVADMLGGHVAKLRPDGTLIARFNPESGGVFNNPVDVSVGKDGRVYLTYSGFVRQLDSDGYFIREDELKCRPVHTVIYEKWLDIACERVGLVSLNTGTGDLQLARFEEPSPKPGGPTGLTYAPDGTLYILDGSTLIAYKVQH